MRQLKEKRSLKSSSTACSSNISAFITSGLSFQSHATCLLAFDSLCRSYMLLLYTELTTRYHPLALTKASLKFREGHDIRRHLGR